MTQLKIVDVADLDVIFLTYDEPLKEQSWIKIQNMVPWAKRVDGVDGTDAAHKSAAALAETDRFILIDGDNIPDSAFFNLSLRLDATCDNKVFRWKARNQINGLQYGNGGLSCWTKEFVNNMRTHEASDGTDANDVEFCFHNDYWAMNDCYSTTYPNASPFQAWRAGFREGVKMCLDRGAKPTLQEFEARVHNRNLDALSIWHNIGADADNGKWAILGARTGTHMTMLTDWNYKEVQDFACLNRIWQNAVYSDVDSNSAEYGRVLKQKLNLPILDYTAEQSKFFKHHYRSNFVNKGIMTRE